MLASFFAHFLLSFFNHAVLVALEDRPRRQVVDDADDHLVDDLDDDRVPMQPGDAGHHDQVVGDQAEQPVDEKHPQLV